MPFHWPIAAVSAVCLCRAWPRQRCWLMWVPVFLSRGGFCEEDEAFVSGALGGLSMWGFSVVAYGDETVR